MPYIVWLMLCLCLISLRGLPLAAAGNHVQATTQPDAKIVLFFGDSLTAGYGLDPAQAFPALIQAKITARGWDFQVINAGLSGETTAGGLRRIDRALQQRPIAVLVLALGANDGLRGLPLADAKRNLQAIIDRTRHTYPQAKIVLAGMQVPTNLGHEYATGFRTIFPELAAVNAATLLAFLLEGVAGIPALNLPDGIHPNPAGHKIIAENVWQVLEPVLQSLQAP
jgi:acyl-CoA thioesterase-1